MPSAPGLGEHAGVLKKRGQAAHVPTGWAESVASRKAGGTYYVGKIDEIEQKAKTRIRLAKEFAVVHGAESEQDQGDAAPGSTDVRPYHGTSSEKLRWDDPSKTNGRLDADAAPMEKVAVKRAAL